MADWYCYVGGRQYGPVSQDILRSWAAEGRVRPADYVWREGMTNWAPARSVFPGLFGVAAVGTAPAGSMVPCGPPGGTGGMTPNGRLTEQARELLRGKWGLPIGFSLLLILLIMAAGMLPCVGDIGSLILGGPLQLGGIIFYMTFARRGNAVLGMLFAGFKNFGNALGAFLLIAIFVLLWALLLIIPGIIAALAYSQAFYLMADDRSLGPMEAIRKSKQIMRGCKGKLFCLGLRFFCWSLLCILTLGIGYLWLMPYASVAYARFYDDLQPPILPSGDSTTLTPAPNSR